MHTESISQTGKSEYVESSIDLQNAIRKAIAQRPIKPLFLAGLVGKKTLEKKGILEKNNYFFQEVITTPSSGGKIESATIITRYWKGGSKRTQDAHIEFTDNGVTIIAQEKETDPFGLDIERKATINPSGVTAEIGYSHINNKWDGWSRYVLPSWHMKPELIKSGHEDGKDSLRVSVTYDKQGDLNTATLVCPDQPTIDLMGKLPSPEEVERIKMKKNKPLKYDLLTALNGRKWQNESGNHLDVNLGKLLILVYPGIFVPTKEQTAEMDLPEGIPPQFTLRFRPIYKEGSNKYGGHYPTILSTLGIYSKLYPSLGEIAKKGFVERGGIIEEIYINLFNMDDNTAEFQKFLAKAS